MSEGQNQPDASQSPESVLPITGPPITLTEQNNVLPQQKPPAPRNFIKERIMSLESKLKAEKEKNEQVNQEKKEKVSEEQKASRSRNKKFHKCQVCRSTGKKSEMKLCHNCGHYTHLACCEDQISANAKFICDRCSFENIKQKAISAKKQQKIAEQQIIKQRVENDQKSKKKLKQGVLQKLRQNRPLMFNNNDQIQYPIEDKLLFIYNQYFNIPELKVTPTDHPMIPCQLLGKFLELENFISTYQKDINFGLNDIHGKQMLYTSMNCQGSDRIFEVILGTIGKVYLKDCFQRSKILNEFNFFTLMNIINQSNQLTLDMIVEVSGELLRNLMQIPNIQKHLVGFKLPLRLTLPLKIDLLAQLIQGLNQIDIFHDIVSKKSERITEMTKQRTDLVAEVKEKESTIIANKQTKIKKMDAPQTKEELDREALKSLVNQHKDRISKITKEIPFVVSQVNYLGSDRNDSKYFFYLGDPHRIYVRYNNFVMDEGENYKIYETKQKIKQFAKSLCSKGIKEKRLQQSINKLLKDQVIRDITIGEDKNDQRAKLIEQLGSCVFVEEDINFKEKIVEKVLQMEQKFTDFLRFKNYQWQSREMREQFLANFSKTEDLKQLKLQLKKLQEQFLYPIKKDGSASSEFEQQKDNQPQKNKKNTKKRKSLKFWGYSGDSMRKRWAECLQNTINFCGVWICLIVMNHFLNTYVEKKMEGIRKQEERRKLEQQKKKKLTKSKKKQLPQIKQTKLRIKNRKKSVTPRKKIPVEPYIKTRRSVNLEALNKRAQKEEQESSSKNSSDEDQEYKIGDDE